MICYDGNIMKTFFLCSESKLCEGKLYGGGGDHPNENIRTSNSTKVYP